MLSRIKEKRIAGRLVLQAKLRVVCVVVRPLPQFIGVVAVVVIDIAAVVLRRPYPVKKAYLAPLSKPVLKPFLIVLFAVMGPPLSVRP